MHRLYNFTIRIAERIIPLSGVFSEKMKLFVQGRKYVFPELEEKISSKDRTIWFHAASLGEYEQAVPVIEEVKEQFPRHKILLTFFSPSGYEVKKNSDLVDVITYLPLDTPENAKKFLDIVHPDKVLFIKYEFWPNFLTELKKRNIGTLLVSGGFREDQIFFKLYGKWMRSYLYGFDHFFVQNNTSRNLLTSIGFENVTVSGDTRFDRVSHQIEQDNSLHFIEEFKNNKVCIVAGSTWPEDEDILVEFINNSSKETKFIIAPHTLKPSRIGQLQRSITVTTMLFSEKAGKDLSQYQVFIIDTIGLLTKIYNYADIAYVGGAMGNSGLHNILEPATFGLPIIIGKNYQRFPEAIKLEQLAGLYSISTKEELASILTRFIENKDFRQKTGMISGHFINQNTGASRLIAEYLARNGAI